MSTHKLGKNATMESALRESEQHYRSVVETVQDTIFVVAPDGTYVSLNPAFEKNTGWPVRDWIGKPFAPLIHPDDLPRAMEIFHAIMSGRPMASYELRVRAATGKYLEVEFISSPWLQNGRVAGVLGVARDITGRKQVEAALRGSNELLALFIKHSPIFAYIKDVSPTESRVLTASENFQDMIGIPGSAMAGKTMADLFPADFAAKMTADDWAVVSSGKLLVQDEELNGRNYTTIKFPLFVGGRKLLAGYTIDITEQKRAAEALRVSETMLNETGRMAKIGGWAIDLVKNTLTWTREVYAIHEVADDFQPSIADAINFYAPESRPVIQQAVERAIQTGEPYDVELELITAKQHRIWVQAIGHALLVAGKAQLVSGTFQDITERKRAEEKLRASEERYRLLHESMMDAFVSVNMDGRIVEFNLVYQAMLGYTAEELRQLIYTDLTPEKWHTMEAKLVTEQIIPRGFSDVYEKEYRRKDGTIFPVELRTYLLRDEQGSPKGMWAIVRDITERKRVELALQESEEKYRIFVQYTRIAVVAHGPDTAVLFSNPMAAQLLGLTSDQMRGKTAIDPAWSFIRENGTRMPLSEYPINRAVASNTPITNLVLGILRPDRAGPTWVQCDTHTIRDPAGQLKQIVVTFFDITERKLALEAQVRLSTAIEQAAETIEITDAAGTILYVNPAFEKTTGYTRAEVLGQNPRMLKSGKHNAEFYLWMWAVLSAGQIWKGRLINKRKNGTFFEEEASIAPVRDAAGQIINYVAVKRDITHEVALEEQHRQAVKLEAVGRLAGGVAHDFNNKLQIILSSVEMILADLQPDHLCRADILEIQKAAQRSSDLTRQLLAFSRQQTITPVLLDVNGTISQSLKMLSRLIGENIHLRFVQKPDAGRVFIDPSQVDQILANLAVNARDAIVGTGHITIEVGPCTLQEADCQDKTDFVPPGDYVVLTFRDDGAGMTPEIQKHIFEPFFTTKGVGKGTGLGLATVYGIVKQNDGAITVQSAPGQGTTFTLYLPRASDAVLLAAAGKDSERIPKGTETLLVVEDEEPVLYLAQRTLALLGYHVLTAPTPKDALRLCASSLEPIHLLLTDVIMPDMSGKVLAESIQKLRPGIRVLFMSGYPADIMEQHGHLPAGRDVLPKPFTGTTLAQRVRAALNAPPPTSPP